MAGPEYMAHNGVSIVSHALANSLIGWAASECLPDVFNAFKRRALQPRWRGGMGALESGQCLLIVPQLIMTEAVNSLRNIAGLESLCFLRIAEGLRRLPPIDVQGKFV